MAALLIGLSVLAVLMTAALPVWSQFAKREKEEELIWRGQQYARAVGLFQRKFANTYPPNLEILIEQRFLRKKYKDPITNDDFQLIPAVGAVVPGSGGPPPAQGGAGRQPAPSAFGAQSPQAFQPTPTPGGRVMVGGVGGSQPVGGLQGVVSKSKDSSIKVFNGRTKYNEWMFVYLAAAQSIGVPGGQTQRPGGGPPGGLQGGERRPGVGQPPFGPGGQPPAGPGQRGPTFGPAQPFGQPTPGTQPPFGRPPVTQPGSRPPGR